MVRDLVILYSGGMDSFILSRMYPEAKKIYVDVKSKYASKEIDNLPCDVQVVRGVNLSAFEREDAIIPSRNLYLVLVAANYGHDIMLGATAGDQSTDKDAKWADMASQITTYMLSGKHFPDRPETKVLLPIKTMSKADLVHWYLSQGHDPVELSNTVSCYSPGQLHCGECKSCKRKWIALQHADVDHTPWSKDPATADWTAEITAIQAGNFRTIEELRETRGVLVRYGIM